MGNITVTKLQEWLLRGHSKTAALCQCVADRDNWWPGDGPAPVDSSRRLQGWFSSWLVGTTLASADDLVRFSAETTYLNKSNTHTPQKDIQSKLIDRLWVNGRKERVWKPVESCVDMSATCWTSPTPVLFSAETEASERQYTHDFLEDYLKDDTRKALDVNYSWDVVKLLELRSPRRLYAARIGAARSASATQRCSQLMSTIQIIVRRHQACLSVDDQLGVILLPNDREIWRDQTVFAVWQNEKWNQRTGIRDD